MRFSARSKGGILLSLITIVAVVSAFMVSFASHGTSSHAASTPVTATYQGKPLTGTQTATSPGIPTKVTQPAHPLTSPLDIESLNPYASKAARKTTASHSGALPTAKGSAIANATEGHLLHNFNGLSDLAQAALIGGEVTPPDQGLCVGHDFTLPGNPTVVIEPINLAIAEYTPSGTLIAAESLFTLFADPFASGDPRCFYDAQKKAFYFTDISFNSVTGNSVDEIAVLDHNGFAVYQFDSSMGGNCFGDQPHVGYDNNNVYITTDEFCNAGYEGALLIAISKPQLLQEVASPNAVFFGPLSLGGDPLVTLQPGISAGIGTEYLLNSFPYDQFGNSNSIANTLGLWQVKGGQHVTTGGIVTLIGRIISSETYAFPQPAASTGNGSVTLVSGFPIESEAFLNPDDDRMQQVQVVNTNGDLDMYAAVNTAINIPGDPSARDGIAWFKVDLEGHSIEAQGYVAAAGSYMLYPTLFHSNSGTNTLVFSITSPTLNPSSAYVVMKSGAMSFGSVIITGAGADQHVSFSDVLFGRARWGDYTASALDPSGNNIWSAAEYIPSLANQDPIDNWGTNVFEVAGD
jgi:hypothetical protein